MLPPGLVTVITAHSAFIFSHRANLSDFINYKLEAKRNA